MSGGGGGGGGDDGVEYQRQQEEARQARIRQGMTRIEELFNGKDVVTGYTGQVNPNVRGVGSGHYYDASGKTYDLANGNSGNLRWAGTSAPGVAPAPARVQYNNGGAWSDLPSELYTFFDRSKGYAGQMDPNVSGIGNGKYYDNTGKAYNLANGPSGNLRWGRGANAAGAPNDARVQYNNGGAWSDLPSELFTGTTTEHQGGFTDAFFDKRATAYQDFALPQVQQQYGDQQKALTFALARGGNLRSSLSSDKNAELDKDFTLQKQAVIDTGRDYANQGKSDMAAQKASAVSMLQATADPDAAYNVAQTSANQLSAMPAFTPLTGVVKNVASGLGTYLNNQATAEAIAKAQQQGGGYSLPSSWKGSGKVGG